MRYVPNTSATKRTRDTLKPETVTLTLACVFLCSAALLQALADKHKPSRRRILSCGGVEAIVSALVVHAGSSKLMQHGSTALDRLGLPAHPEDDAAVEKAAKALEEARSRWPRAP